MPPAEIDKGALPLRKRAIAILAALAVLALGVLGFFRTRDPMILMLAIYVLILAGLALGVRWIVRTLAAGRTVVKTRCLACGGLNDEHARFCGACGQPV